MAARFRQNWASLSLLPTEMRVAEAGALFPPPPRTPGCFPWQELTRAAQTCQPGSSLGYSGQAWGCGCAAWFPTRWGQGGWAFTSHGLSALPSRPPGRGQDPAPPRAMDRLQGGCQGFRGATVAGGGPPAQAISLQALQPRTDSTIAAALTSAGRPAAQPRTTTGPASGHG